MRRAAVGVVGAGSWGTTLAKVLADNGHDVRLWSRRGELCRAINEQHENFDYLPGVTLAPNVRATADLAEVGRETAFILFVVPSHGFRGVARELGAHLDGEHSVVHATKGFELGTFKRMSEILREETCVRKLGVLSGPNLARELARGEPAGTLVASAYRETTERAAALLGNKYLRVYSGRDVIGAEVGGAFKNIVALAAGVASGLGLGENSKALLLTRGLAEMTRLGVLLGADARTFAGMSGMGDLVATCSSPLSRNYQVGHRLAQGESLQEIQSAMKMVAEGVKATHAVDDLASSRGLTLPIVSGVKRLLDGHDVMAVLGALMAERTGHEVPELQ